METGFTVKFSKGTMQLVRQVFLNGEISIRLPESLVDLSGGELKKRYISLGTSDALKVNPEHRIMFSLFVNEISPQQENEQLNDGGQVAAALELQRRTISRIAPGYQEHGMRYREIDGHTVGCLSYKSNSTEDDMYNIFYVFFSENEMVTGAFSCQMEDHEEWSNIFLMCLDTLKLKAKTIENSPIKTG